MKENKIKKLKEKNYEGMHKNPTSHIPPHTSERGITLIALVITIIVMLILVAVTITVAINGGLFSYAGKAAVETEKAKDAEQNLANGRVKVGEQWYNNIDDYLNNIPSEDQEESKGNLLEKIQIGDYVNYTPAEGTFEVTPEMSGYSSPQSFTTQKGDEALKWAVWKIDKETGTVELISTTPTSEKLILQGANGYNHGVDILNDLCKALYSNGNAVARSVNVEDINNRTTYDITTYSEYEISYGTQPVTFQNGYYPSIYEAELGSTEDMLTENETTKNLLGPSQGVRNSDGTANYTKYTGYKSKETFKPTFSWYEYSAEHFKFSILAQFKSIDFRKLVHGYGNSIDYWLASRGVYALPNCINFALRYVDSSNEIPYITGWNLFSGQPEFVGDRNESINFAFRPIISLPSSSTWTAVDSESSSWDVAF